MMMVFTLDVYAAAGVWVKRVYLICIHFWIERMFYVVLSLGVVVDDDDEKWFI